MPVFVLAPFWLFLQICAVPRLFRSRGAICAAAGSVTTGKEQD